MSMYWNHRVVKFMDGDEPILTLAEVYYRADTKVPYSYHEPFVISETIDGIHQIVKQFGEAARQPILSFPEDFEKKAQDDVEDETPVAPV